jgi:hypothetical protein
MPEPTSSMLAYPFEASPAFEVLPPCGVGIVLVAEAVGNGSLGFQAFSTMYALFPLGVTVGVYVAVGALVVAATPAALPLVEAAAVVVTLGPASPEPSASSPSSIAHPDIDSARPATPATRAATARSAFPKTFMGGVSSGGLWPLGAV